MATETQMCHKQTQKYYKETYNHHKETQRTTRDKEVPQRDTQACCFTAASIFSSDWIRSLVHTLTILQSAVSQKDDYFQELDANLLDSSAFPEKTPEQ